MTRPDWSGRQGGALCRKPGSSGQPAVRQAAWCAGQSPLLACAARRSQDSTPHRPMLVRGDAGG